MPGRRSLYRKRVENLRLIAICIKKRRGGVRKKKGLHNGTGEGEKKGPIYCF